MNGYFGSRFVTVTLNTLLIYNEDSDSRTTECIMENPTSALSMVNKVITEFIHCSREDPFFFIKIVNKKVITRMTTAVDHFCKVLRISFKRTRPHKTMTKSCMIGT